MTLPWFRLYVDALNNPKVQRLSGDEFKTWINLLCLASKKGGHIPPLEDAAFALRLTLDTAKAHTERLVASKLLLEIHDGFEPKDWATWQMPSDNAAERMRKMRLRKKMLTGEVSNIEPSSASVTKDVREEAVSRSVVLRNGYERTSVTVTKGDGLDKSREEENRLEERQTRNARADARAGQPEYSNSGESESPKSDDDAKAKALEHAKATANKLWEFYGLEDQRERYRMAGGKEDIMLVFRWHKLKWGDDKILGAATACAMGGAVPDNFPKWASSVISAAINHFNLHGTYDTRKIPAKADAPKPERDYSEVRDQRIADQTMMAETHYRSLRKKAALKSWSRTACGPAPGEHGCYLTPKRIKEIDIEMGFADV